MYSTQHPQRYPTQGATNFQQRLRSLPDLELIQLCQKQGLSYEEIIVITSSETGTVKSRISRAFTRAPNDGTLYEPCLELEQTSLHKSYPSIIEKHHGANQGNMMFSRKKCAKNTVQQSPATIILDIPETSKDQIHG